MEWYTCATGIHLCYWNVPVLLPLPLHMDTSVEAVDARRTAPFPIHSLHVPAISSPLTRGLGVLGSIWLPDSSQPWSFRTQVAKAQLLQQSQSPGAACSVPSGVPNHTGMPLGILCLFVISFWFLKFALALLLAGGMISMAGLQATLGQPDTVDFSCLLLLVPQTCSPQMATGDLSASPCSSLLCFNHLPVCFPVFCCSKDEFGPHR